jgi:O-antigen ligase
MTNSIALQPVSAEIEAEKAVETFSMSATPQPRFKNFVALLFVLYAASLASSMAGMEMFGTAITVVALLAALTKKIPLKKTGVEMALLVFSVAVVIGALLANGLPMKMRIDAVGQLRWILLLYALTTLFSQYADWQKKFVNLLIGFYVIVAIYSVYQAFTGDTLFGILDATEADHYGGHALWRARGLFSNTMSYSYCLGQCMTMAFAFFIGTRREKSSRDYKYLYFFAAMAVSLVFTYTRGAWVGSGIALVAMSFLYNWRLGLKVTGSIAALVVVCAMISPAVHDRLLMFTQASPDQAVSERYDLWRANWAMFKDHPWFGVGYGYNYYFTPEYNQKIFGHPAFVAQAHNNFLQVIAGCGLVGFLAWVTFCGYFLWLSAKTFWQRRHENSWLGGLALGIFGAQVFFHIGGLTQSTFFDAKPTYVLLCEWALLLAAIAAEKLYVGREFVSVSA